MPTWRSPFFFAVAALGAACAAAADHSGFTGASTGGGGAKGASSSTGEGGGVVLLDGGLCPTTCSSDLHSVIDCRNNVAMQCSGTDACDTSTGTCANACKAAVNNKQAVGCEYYATDMDEGVYDPCFAAFVANTWDTPVHIQVDFAGTPLPIASFAFIPNGSGPTLTYAPYNSVSGLAPGQVAILFLAGTEGPPTAGNPACPKHPAMPTDAARLLQKSGTGFSFHITTDVPVVAYQMNPYGGGAAAVTGASLLLPTSVWDVNYVVATVSPNDIYGPSMNIIAAEDDTTVTMLPRVAVAGGIGLPPGPANIPYKFLLQKGEMAQFTQQDDLTGSIIQSNKPIGFMAGQPCMQWPVGVPACDHGEQMVPPVKALGSEYVAVMYRPRLSGDQATWHMIGVVNGTTLTYSSGVGGPATLDEGQVANFVSDQPFVVKSQDAMHPFMLFTYMSGGAWTQLSNTNGYGDPDFVIDVPPQQYMRDYVFFADPTYPETNLVIIRSKNAQMAFDDVSLDCAGVLGGWAPVGEYEWTRIDLMSHDFVPQNGCSTGVHQIHSKSPFGIWVWGWGTPETSTNTAWVSYGYPGGMNVQPINSLVIPPTSK